MFSWALQSLIHPDFHAAFRSMSFCDKLRFIVISPFPPRSTPRNPRRRASPITISMNPSHLDPLQLRDLLLSCDCAEQSTCASSAARKLRRALAHSFVVVSIFCRARFLDRTMSAMV